MYVSVIKIHPEFQYLSMKITVPNTKMTFKMKSAVKTTILSLPVEPNVVSQASCHGRSDHRWYSVLAKGTRGCVSNWVGGISGDLADAVFARC